MDKEEIRRYVEDGLRKGYSLKNLKDILIENGVNESDAEEVTDSWINEKKAEKVTEKTSGRRGEKRTRVIIIVILFILGIVIATVGYLAINTLIKDAKLFGNNTDSENEGVFIDEFSQCRGMTEEDAELCKIQIVTSLKNESLCEINLGGKTLDYTWQNEDMHFNLSANDLCWIRISEIKKINYCSKINSVQGRDVCNQKMTLLI